MRRPLDPWTYRWSSHGTYLGKRGLVGVSTAMALGELANSVGRARRAYLRFMAEGNESGHQPDFYHVRDQRFLGDERFVEQIDGRIRAEREIEVPGPKANFLELLRLTAEAYGITERDLVRRGCQRKWVKPRSMLVYFVREWGRASVKEIGRRWHRDPSIISRLYSAYAADRDAKKEALLVQRLRH